MHAFHALAMANANPKDIRWIFICGGVLIGLMLIAFFAYTAFKRWMNDDTATSETHGFGLSDMRRLRDEGKISAEEYELTRAKMVAAAKKMTAHIPDMSPRQIPPGQTPKFPPGDANPSDPPASVD
jgi:hypothetical protein